MSWVNTAESYEAALPILLEHLEKPHPGRVREGIARALAVPEAKFGWDTFMHMYRDEEERDAKEVAHEDNFTSSESQGQLERLRVELKKKKRIKYAMQGETI